MGTQGGLPCRFQMGQLVNLKSILPGACEWKAKVNAIHFYNDGRVTYDIGNDTTSELHVDQLRITAVGGNHDTRVADHQRNVEKRTARDEQRRKDGYTGMSKRNGS